jgi:hypothetical protein
MCVSIKNTEPLISQMSILNYLLHPFVIKPETSIFSTFVIKVTLITR